MVLKIAEALRRLQREEKGFTLIELVIVLAIIGILLAIGIPVYNSTMERAAWKAHDTNLRTIDSAVQQYLMGEGTYPTNIDALVTEGNKYLEEIPEIPKQLQTRGDNWKNYSLETVAEGEVPWAQPVGDWEGAYRKK